MKQVGDIFEYRLKANNLTILYKQIPDTGVVTTNITYKVGSRDEVAGETGLAHMLEHMVFKPTKQDLVKKIDSGAMQFERDTGCILNANTWKDRTTYFFNYPAPYLSRALQIEAERMVDVVLSDKEFLPERGNVLSEFDMYNGDPYFALSVQMVSTAFHANPYGHETIGYREDIERYTPAKLNTFYKRFYRPDNATLMIIGDVPLATALTEAKKQFGTVKNPTEPIVRHTTVEPKQEGERRVSIVRESTTNVVAIGIKHPGFPTQDWFTTAALFSILTDGPDSLLHTAFVDTGKATRVEGVIEPTADENIGILFVTLAPGQDHAVIEKEVLATIASVTSKMITKPLQKVIQKTLTDELFGRASSMGIVHELTEYTAAGDWTVYFETEKKLRAITAASLLTLRTKLFNQNQLTIGYFIGKK